MNPRQFTINGISFTGSLTDQVIFDRISFVIDLVTSDGSGTNNYKVLKELEHAFKDAGSLGQLEKKYQEMILRLKFACFSLLPNQDVEEVFQSHLFEAFKNSIDLKQKTSLLFLLFFDQKDFNRLNGIIRAIEANNELIGDENITVMDKPVVSIVSNWLKDYKSKVTEDKGGLNVASYMTNDQNHKHLKPEEFEFLEYVLSLYDWLRFHASKTSYLSEDASFEAGQKMKLIAATPKPVVPTPVKAKTVDQIAKKTAQTNPAEEFQKKLDAAGLAHGQSLEEFKKKLEQTVSFAPKKNVIATENPGKKLVDATHPLLTPEEIKRETTTPELPVDFPDEKTANSVTHPEPVIQQKKDSEYVSTIKDVQTIEDLKRIDLKYLRQRPLNIQIDMIKNRSMELIKAGHLLSFYPIEAFKQSPLFKEYLEVGSEMMINTNPDRKAAFNEVAAKLRTDMKLEEFEAVADLRKQLERL